MTTGKILKQIQEFWQKQNKKTRVVIIVSLVALIMVAISSSFLLNRKNYVVLYRGLSSSEGAEIITKLESMPVDVKVENDGTIRVPQSDEARLKMQLASEGYPKNALTYDVFKNNSDFMTTDFDKKQYLIFQLQDRLQNSIKTLQGVNNAIVTISLPDDNSFVLEADKVSATASVIIDMQGGTTLDSLQIKGIEELVSKSIPGLENKNVIIVDNTGTILNNGNDNPDDAIISSKMEMEKKVNKIIEDKIISLLQPVFGEKGVRVAANAVIDFQKKVSQVTTYNPVVGNNGVISKINQVKESSGNSSAAAGVPGTGSNTGITSYAQNSSNNGATNTSTNEQSTTEYLVNQIQDQIQQDGGEIKDLTVAVLIDDKGLSDKDITKLKDLVAYAAGINQDKVIISEMAFTAVNDLKKQVQKALTPDDKNSYGPDIFIYTVPAALVFLIIAIIFIFIKIKHKKISEEDKLLTEGRVPLLKQIDKNKSEDIPSAIVLNETREQGLKRQIKDFTSANPEIVAQLLRTWIVEEDDQHG